MIRRSLILGVLGAVLLVKTCPVPIAGAALQSKSRTKQEALNRAMIHAVRKQDVRAVRSLLAQGANPNAQDTPAHPAHKGIANPALLKEPATALLIVFEEAATKTKSVRGDRKSTAGADPAEMARALLEQGADPNVQDFNGKFPLLLAVENRYATSTRLLVDHGAKVNQTWVHGITPLHIAVDNKDISTVKFLMARGADAALQSAFDNPAHPLGVQVRELLEWTGERQGESLQQDQAR